jgi:hypothetical protein
VESLFKLAGISASQFKYILCPTPKLAEKYKVTCPDNMKSSAVEVWKLPEDYGNSKIE